MLYFLNEELKSFCKINKYDLIKLDEIIQYSLPNSFIDEIHTNEKGSKKISEIIYLELKEILNNYYN